MQVIPSSDFVGILYWVFAGSVGAYFLFSWANQYIEASLVAAYTALQPVTTGIATYLALVRLEGGGRWWAVFGGRLRPSLHACRS